MQQHKIPTSASAFAPAGRKNLSHPGGVQPAEGGQTQPVEANDYNAPPQRGGGSSGLHVAMLGETSFAHSGAKNKERPTSDFPRVSLRSTHGYIPSPPPGAKTAIRAAHGLFPSPSSRRRGGGDQRNEPALRDDLYRGALRRHRAGDWRPFVMIALHFSGGGSSRPRAILMRRRAPLWHAAQPARLAPSTSRRWASPPIPAPPGRSRRCCLCAIAMTPLWPSGRRFAAASSRPRTSRFAWAAFYSWETGSQYAKFVIIAIHVRNRSFYDDYSDVIRYPNDTASVPATLEGEELSLHDPLPAASAAPIT